MNSLEILLSVFQDGEYISKNVIASRIRDSPYPIKSTDLIGYLGTLLSSNSKCFTSKQGTHRVRLYCRTLVGDSLLTPSVLNEIILANLPTGKYLGFRGILSRTRISKTRLKSSLLSLIREGRVVRRTSYEKEKEAHYLKLEKDPVSVEVLPESRIPVSRVPKATVLPEPEKPKPTFPVLRRKKCPT